MQHARYMTSSITMVPSVVGVQVIASGFETYSGTLNLDGPSKQLTIRMRRPQEQYSTYEKRSGASTEKAGVQEADHRTIQPKPNKPITATDPVLKLPSAPADPKANGDPTVAPAADHNVTPPPSSTPPPQPNRSSAPLGNQAPGTTTAEPN